MKARTILALAAAGILAAACTSTGASTASTTPAEPVAAVSVEPPAQPPDPTVAPVAPDPTATPVPQTDGEGDEVVVGELANPSLVTPYTQEQVGDVMQYRDGLVTMTQTMNDPRVTGAVKFTINLDLYSKVASQQGTWTLITPGGSWTGPCTGGAWADSDGLAWGCWLTGSGDYAGYTYFQTVVKEIGEAPVVHGVIYKGEPPV